MVSQIIERMQVDHLLDYGCGAQTNLAKHLKVNRKLMYQAYDPGVPRFSKPPVPAQMVTCIDVLEHIEPELIDNVLDDLKLKLLSGNLDSATVSRLRDAAANLKSSSGDPGLDSVLSEIELRVEVELAKAGQH